MNAGVAKFPTHAHEDEARCNECCWRSTVEAIKSLRDQLAAMAEGKHDLATETDYDVDVARFNGEGTGLGIAHMMVADLLDEVTR